MHGRSGARDAAWIFAAGLALRPILIAPMAPSGPLGGSELLPAGLAVVTAISLLLAAGVAVGNRWALAIGIFTAVDGIGLAAFGAWAGLSMPWPVVMAADNVVLAALGILAWRRRRGAPPG